MSLAETFEDIVLDQILGTTEMTFDSTLYLALGSDDAVDKSTFTEITTAGTNGYARQAITFTDASGGQASNDAQIVFGPCATVGWGTVKSWAIYDAATAGNRRQQNVLSDQTKVVGVGDSYTFEIGTVVVSAV
jgi:hypothetical protein